MTSHVFCLIDSSIALRYSTATWSKQQFKPFNIWFTVFTCRMENSISWYWISLFTCPLFQFLFRDRPNKICEEFIARKHKGVGGGSPLKKSWYEFTVLLMTYQEQTRGFHVTSYYVVQKTWTLQQKTTNRKRKDKQLHDSSEDYKDVFRFNSGATRA